MLPLAPLVVSAIAHDISYARRYKTTLLRGATHARAMFRDRAISRYLLHRGRKIPPGAHERIVGACTHCGNCCLNRGCVFLEFDPVGRSRCEIYGSRFWRLLNCSRYPESRTDIELYQCNSFFALPAPASEAPRYRVIPVWRAEVPAVDPVER